MPIGEFIAEVLFRGIFEIIIYGLLYYSGAFVLSIVSLGQLRLAPLSSFDDKNRKKQEQWFDWSIWLHRPMQGKMLKAEYVMLAGFLVWIIIGISIFLVVRTQKPESEQAVAPNRSLAPSLNSTSSVRSSEDF